MNTNNALAKLLADSYTLYLKTHNYHWNVTGPWFASLHTLFETQYNELALAVDEIAERIRTLGDKAPGSYAEFSELTEIKESRGSDKIAAEDMVKNLMQDHLTVAQQAKKVLAEANEQEDDPTADLATQRMTLHEKTAWMLRSIIE